MSIPIRNDILTFVFFSSILLISNIRITFGENILVVMPLTARSHFKSFQPLFEELIKRRHNLTLISGFSLSEDFRGKYQHIDVKCHFSKLDVNFAEMRTQNRLHNFIFASHKVSDYNEFILQDERIRDFIADKNSNYHSIIAELFFADVWLAFGHHFNAPVIGLSPQNMIASYIWNTGNSINPSYVPNMFLPFTDRMSYWQRILNSVYTAITASYYEFVVLPKHQKLIETYFHFENDKEIPKVKDMLKNLSLILVNSHFSFGYPIPHSSNTIQTAGLHITEPRPLPSNLQNFIDNASDGIIYVSLGSLIQPDDVQPLGNTFLQTLKNLPQRVVLKWNPKLLPYIPDNFLVQEWIPQTSVLSHPKCRLFITHGGLHSLLESVNYSVPLVGIPFYTDQQHNMALVEHLGIGIALDIDTVSARLSSAVQRVLSNPRYHNNMKRQSRKFNDRIVSPLNTAAYWVEHVMRHEDVSHLKCASTELQWYQYALLDVALFVIIVLLSLFSLIYFIFRKFCNIVGRILTNNIPTNRNEYSRICKNGKTD